ncbi:MAG: hypothetical protein IK137_00690 [Bacilli bacterium]|nr:hypothetical protein [Bacilli bacterium]
MKVWRKIRIKDKNKDVLLLSKSLTNYLYGYGPVLDICRKYNISKKDRAILDEYTANRIAGLLMLYISHNFARINDIANKYNLNDDIKNINPEIEAYIDK